ncbi:hypothetical protein OG280_26395 [Streptomyces virginiae]|uniref:hypothetical protein n=1 Tax=Streptomyces virginiae TaxID=1961 RepID=UPI0032449B6B
MTPALVTMIPADVMGFDGRTYPALVSGPGMHGGVNPYFSLDTMRAIAADTAADVARYGHDRVDAVHVIDGGTDSSGNREAVVLAICWGYYDQDGPEGITRVISPTEHGLYPGAGLEWVWDLADDPSTETR